jgi:nucleoside-diphosphate-sugar epimerase
MSPRRLKVAEAAATRVFVAGATGAIGKPLVPLLLASGHQVVGMTRSPQKVDQLRTLGATPVVADGLDRRAVVDAVVEAKPDAVIHQLTALTGFRDMKHWDREWEQTDLLRTRGTDHLLEGAQAAGARRFVAQSYAGWPYAREGGRVKTEAEPLDPSPPAGMGRTLDAIRYLEEHVLAADLEGLALRYGSLYGPGTSIAGDGDIVEMVRGRRMPIVGGGIGIWSFVHIEDAASATAAAVERGSPGRVQHRRRRSREGLGLASRTGQGGWRKAADATAGMAGPGGRGTAGHLDDDPRARGVQRQGEKRARLGAALSELARGVPHRPRRRHG